MSEHYAGSCPPGQHCCLCAEDALRKRLAAADADRSCLVKLLEADGYRHQLCVTELHQANQRLAAAVADAARYRFLREHKARASGLRMDGTAQFHFTNGWPYLIGNDLDSAVDAAIATWNNERAKEGS